MFLAHTPGQTGRPALSSRTDVSVGFSSIEGISSGTWSVAGISSESGSAVDSGSISMEGSMICWVGWTVGW